MPLNRDPVVERIVEAVMDRPFDSLSNDVVDATRVRIADAVGCALSGRDTEAGRLTWGVATTAPSQRGRVLGRRSETSLESAALCNTAMIRCEDLNDSYNDVGSGHPSDLIGTALTIGAHAGVDGATLISTVSGAYDALCGMFDHTRIGRVVWDQGTALGPVAAAVAGRLLGLDRRQVGHAVSMSAVSSMSVRQTRQGQLSVWKNIATAFAAKGAVTATLLAAAGAEGPDQPFVGKRGVGVPLFPDAGVPELAKGAIVRTNLKFIPCCYHAHVCVELAARARAEVDIDRISRIVVSTYDKAYTGLAAEPEKWRPTTAATADHSMAYVIASTLLDGGLTHESFRAERLTSPQVATLMDRIEAVEDPAMTSAFPEVAAARMEVYIDGAAPVFTDVVNHPLGHHKRPGSSADLESKFINLGMRATGPDGCEVLRSTYQRLLHLEKEPDVASVLDGLPAV
jgi:2-methylcitrate dehydratase